jgi:hypothetical protein
LRVDPILPVIEEEIRVQAGGIVNRIPWHGNECGILLNVEADACTGYPDINADLSRCGREKNTTKRSD